MKIAVIEPFFGGSHKLWATALQHWSRHEISLFTLPDRSWKWRMHGGAISLAKAFLASNFEADIILASDMLDVNLFLSLSHKKVNKCKTAIYFHENQLSYPWSPSDKDPHLQRDMHYAFINVASALRADILYFNSQYHQDSFLEALPSFLNAFPDFQEKWMVKNIQEKASVLPLGMDLADLIQQNVQKEKEDPAVLLWNHRWEYDKQPEAFFQVLFALKQKGIVFKLIVLGESHQKYPAIFDEAKEKLIDEMIHWGFVESKAQYQALLAQADILPVTAIQDFFGGSVVEAIASNVCPLLPNRLAYPEHIPSECRETYLYNNIEDLVNKLQKLIFDVAKIRQQNFAQWVAKYDWKQCIQQYDDVFQELGNHE